MAILVLSIIASVVLGCLLWLVIGDKFPLRHEVKLPPLNNIVIYVLALLLPVYVLIFALF